MLLLFNSLLRDQLSDICWHVSRVLRDSDSTPFQNNLQIPVQDSTKLPTHLFPLDLKHATPEETNAAGNVRKFSSEISRDKSINYESIEHALNVVRDKEILSPGSLQIGKASRKTLNM